MDFGASEKERTNEQEAIQPGADRLSVEVTGSGSKRCWRASW